MKITAFLIALILVLCNVTSTYSKDFPSEFWQYNDLYAKAVEQKDNYKIIEYSSKLIEIIKNEPQTDQINEIMGSRLDQMGLAYERLGDYANAGVCYEQYIPYAQLKGWDDGVKIAKAKVLQYTRNIDVYISHEEKSEKVLFGTNFDGETRKDLPNETMILVYIEFGDDNFTWLEHTLKEAQSTGKTVEVALNLPGEGNQVASVLNNEVYIISLLKKIESYNNVKTFLRFGAEMNVWTRVAAFDEFIASFRFVSKLAQQYTTNTAMVWSVNQVSSWSIDMNDYYPGDEYVDYVGISAYSQKYFLGRNDWSEFDSFNEIVFLAGKSADPVKALTEVVMRYGNRKPIIIAEGGSSHFVRTINEDTTNWAVMHLKKLYHYVPMVYPQIKMIAYFDKSMPNEVNEYSLSNNKLMADEFIKLTKLPHFKGNIRYEKLDNTLKIEQKLQEIYSYIHIYDHNDISVDYYVNDVLVSSAHELPYKCNIDFSVYPLGNLNFKAVAHYNGDILHEKLYNISVIERGISVMLNNNKILFDTSPMLISGRTLVPMRAIFEAMGAKVTWDNDTQTITSSVADTTIIMQLGNNIMKKGNAEITLDVEPMIYGERTLVPIRAISEAMGAIVTWDSDTRTVFISKN